MRYSHSRVECFKNCKFKFKCRYLDEIKVIGNKDPNNALICGSALHQGLETNVQDAIKLYCSNYNIILNENVREIIKLKYWIPKVHEIIGSQKIFAKEFKLECDNFIGYIDLMTLNRDGTVDIFDYKYSNNISGYMKSPQLHLYKYYLEKKGIKVKRMGYIFIPKVNLKKSEFDSEEIYRKKLLDKCVDYSIQLIEITYDELKVEEYHKLIKDIEVCDKYTKNVSPNCRFCEYEDYCLKGENYMLLPKCTRRDITKVTKRKIWIYGASMSGKTTMLDNAPNPLNINTDGNIQFVTMPYVELKDGSKWEGRIKKTIFGWETFEALIEELEEKNNEYNTIILDLMEDAYEMCRLFMYSELNITHESDDSFRAWDKVRTRFLSTMRRFFNLDYENLVIISHEDKSKDITKSSGDKVTAIKPNITDKIASKVAGMVDIVARVTIKGNERKLNFKSDNVIFGGGRLKNIKETEIPLSWENLMKVYENANKGVK